MTYRAFRLIRGVSMTCPKCRGFNKNASLIAAFGHCGTCAMRIVHTAHNTKA
jgi:hypothetical protein